jgi:ATP-dependent DNA helicase RecQ
MADLAEDLASPTGARIKRRAKPEQTLKPAGSWQPRMKRLLRETFGLKHLRDGQESVIARVMAGLPTIAVMPTGAGKSLCYQLPALMLPGLTVVVSPLIALMKDQCDKLRQLGIAAVQWNSAIDAEEAGHTRASIADGSARIVFTTPEQLAGTEMQAALSACEVSLLVVDEAHCVTQWGHDFRPAFLEIRHAARRLGKPTLLALTATATDEVLEDLAHQLGMRDAAIINTGVYRANLVYRVEAMHNDEDKLARAVALVAESAGAGIVYAATVAAVDTLHQALVEAGQAATKYHGRLGSAERQRNQDAFMRGEARVIVATNAFGLGIDKADTRFVIHYQMPGGLDAYYQESGRAGRDGKTAHCTLLFQHSDQAVQRFFLVGKYPSTEDIDAVYRALSDLDDEAPRFTLDTLVDSLDRPRAKLQVALALLRDQGIVAQDKQGRLKLRRRDIDAKTFEALMQAYRDKREHDKAMLEQMVFYGQTGYCRWKVLLEHFDDTAEPKDCTHCDNCLRLAEAARQELLRAMQTASTEDPIVVSAAVRAFAIGERVRVARYGTGKVEKVEFDTVTVDFGNGRRRAFLASFVSAA